MSDQDKQTLEPIADKLPPQNVEAEQSVLGCLMLDKDVIIKVADVLKPQDFYRGIHQIIYEAMVELYEHNEPIDTLSTSNKLKEKGKLDEIGGVSYLTNLVNSVPTAAHVSSYAHIIQKKSILRRLIAAANEITFKAYKENEDVEEVLDESEQKIFNVSQKYLHQNFVPIKPALEEAFERIDKLHKGDGVLRGIPTGFYSLDNILGGLQKADLVILASRPSLGKTTLALDIARHVATKEKIPVGLFSLETSKEQIVDHLISAQAGVDLWKLRTGRLSLEGEDNDFSKIAHAMDILSKAPIYIDDAGANKLMEMRTMARRLQAEYGLGLIIVDYLQLMQSTNFRESLVQQITEISRGLKSLAKELNVPILALSQLSRAVENRSPQIPRLSDLRESGSIEQDADVVLFIYREDREKKDASRQNVADIIIGKHRNGPIGKVELYFDENNVTFKNLETKMNELT